VHPQGGRPVRLAAGDYFGEMALLDGARRSASVEAVSEVLTMRVGRPAFAKLLKQEPQIALALLATLADRVRQLEQKSAASRARAG
jgi:CRP-like cAMP-binding protein